MNSAAQMLSRVGLAALFGSYALTEDGGYEMQIQTNTDVKRTHAGLVQEVRV